MGRHGARTRRPGRTRTLADPVGTKDDDGVVDGSPDDVFSWGAVQRRDVHVTMPVSIVTG